MTQPLTFTSTRRPDGTTVLNVVGEIDMGNADTFSAAVSQAVDESGAAPAVVDLTGVGYLDSAGLVALFTHASRIEVVAGPLLGPVLTISGLTEVTTVHGVDGTG
jgi:anti-anti-sigma factor